MTLPLMLLALVMTSTPKIEAPVDSLFQTALSQHAMMRYYVRITLSAKGDEPTRITCLPAQRLLWALIREHGLESAAKQWDAATAIALATPRQTFSLQSPSAAALLPEVNILDVDEITRRLSDKSNEQLQRDWNRLAAQWLPGRMQTRLRQEAIACALLERGLLPFQDDVSGQIRLR